MVLYYQKDQQSVKCIPLPTSNDGFSLLGAHFDIEYGKSIFDKMGQNVFHCPPQIVFWQNERVLKYRHGV